MEREARAAWASNDVAGVYVRLSGQRVVDPQVGCQRAQVAVGVVVPVENGHLRHVRLAVGGGQVLEETSLRLLIRLECAVEVEVLVGHVRHDGDVEITARDPLLGQAV